MGKVTKRDSGPGRKGPWSDKLKDRLEQAIDQFHGHRFRNEKITLSEIDLYVLLNDALGHIVLLEDAPRVRKGITRDLLWRTMYKHYTTDTSHGEAVRLTAKELRVTPKTIYERLRKFGIEFAP